MDGGADGAAPSGFEALRALLMARGPSLPRRLAQVAAFAMAHPDEIALGTAAGIAEKAQVQPSTLVRFAQAFGYAGFSELQGVFRERLRDRIATYDDRLRALKDLPPTASRAAVLFEGFCDAAARSLAALRERTDIGAVEAAAAILAKADTLYLVGQRRSFPITAYMSYAFGKLGVKTVLIGSAAGTDPETVAFATPRDAMFAVSFTPYAPTTLGLARQAVQQGVPLVAVTDSPFSPLVAGALAWFEVVEVDYSGFRPLSATLALAMTLAVAVGELHAATK